MQRFFFGGVPQSILYDNTKIAVARILGDGKRQRTRVSGFSACGGARVGGRGKGRGADDGAAIKPPESRLSPHAQRLNR